MISLRAERIDVAAMSAVPGLASKKQAVRFVVIVDAVTGLSPSSTSLGCKPRPLPGDRVQPSHKRGYARTPDVAQRMNGYIVDAILVVCAVEDPPHLVFAR